MTAVDRLVARACACGRGPVHGRAWAAACGWACTYESGVQSASQLLGFGKGGIGFGGPSEGLKSNAFVIPGIVIIGIEPRIASSKAFMSLIILALAT